MADGESMRDFPIPEGSLTLDISIEYRVRSTRLANILTQKLREANQNELIRTLHPTLRTNNGLLILEAIIAILLPVTTLNLLDLIDELCEITHRNEETVDYLGTRLQNLFARLNAGGCKTMADLHMAFAQHCVLRGTYKLSRPIRSLLDQLMLQDKTLQNWKTPMEFFSAMTSLFTDGKIFKAGVMQPVNVPRV